MLRSNECLEDEFCLATNVQARMPMANVFDDLATQFQLLGRNYEIGITK